MAKNQAKKKKGAPVGKRNQQASKQAKAVGKGIMSKGSGPMLSPCAEDYARCLGNPSTGPRGACIPSFPALNTYKPCYYSKGQFSTGAAASGGFGFILFDPFLAVANDQPSIIASSNAYAVNNTTNVVPGAGVVGTATNGEFAAAAFGNNAQNLNQFRVVGASLKVRYIGTNLNEGGQLVGLQDPAHISLSGRSFADFDAVTESRRFPVDRKWTEVFFTPLDDLDLNFQGNLQSYTVGPPNLQHFLGFCVQSPDSTGAIPTVMEYEAYAHFELTGRNLRNKTLSHVDPAGFGAVHAVAVASPVLSSPQKTTVGSGLGDKMVKLATTYLGTSTSRTGTQMIPHPAQGPSFWDELWNAGKKILPAVLEAIPFLA
jgi:hypothetical protein